MTTPLSDKIQPWYRHRWPWMLMAGPLIAVVAGLFTAYLAVTSNDGLVDDDYYKQGLAVNKVTERDQKARSLGLQAEVMQGSDGVQLRVLLSAKPAVALPEALTLRLVHPTRGGVDQSALLRAAGGGSYTGKLAAPLAGRWHVALEDDQKQWRLTGNWAVEKNASLHLPGAAKAGVDSYPPGR
ncbi:MAG: hypothetical protein H6R17_3137 [Proteobacteria bacterium]|nr:hypothetical protein [Pseudomonadota bacterium]